MTVKTYLYAAHPSETRKVDGSTPSLATTGSHHAGQKWTTRFMPLTWEQVVIDAHDHRELGLWWARPLDWIVTNEDVTDVEIRSAADHKTWCIAS